ncbi:MAG TPA: hypothetical protein VIM65_17335 [Cyclobacteriaceae bacterium]
MSGEDKVFLLRTLSERIASLRYTYDAQEKSIIRRILNEEEWYRLSDDEKQSKRRATISLGKKWSNDYFLGVNEKSDYSYEEGVILVYDAIRDILSKITEKESTTDLLRVKAFLVIEKDFIDENLRSNKHLPPEFFENIANTLSSKYHELQLDKFYVLYSDMYEKWTNKPKPVT